MRNNFELHAMRMPTLRENIYYNGRMAAVWFDVLSRCNLIIMIFEVKWENRNGRISHTAHVYR